MDTSAAGSRTGKQAAKIGREADRVVGLVSVGFRSRPSRGVPRDTSLDITLLIWKSVLDRPKSGLPVLHGTFSFCAESLP